VSKNWNLVKNIGEHKNFAHRNFRQKLGFKQMNSKFFWNFKNISLAKVIYVPVVLVNFEIFAQIWAQ